MTATRGEYGAAFGNKRLLSAPVRYQHPRHVVEASAIASEPDIPLVDLGPEIEDQWSDLIEAFQDVLRSRTFILGPNVAALEEEIGDYLGVRHAIGVNSGTDALVIGLRCLGIGPGDEVITTPFTFCATAEAIHAVGARPVYADIDPDTYNVSVAAVERLITSRTRAVLPVHLFGRPADMSALVEVARAARIAIIEDVAQALGASTPLGMAGSVGEVGALSFFPSKTLGGFGDGGMVVTDDDDLADQARMLRSHGSRRKYLNEVLGYNSRLDEVQAALLRVKLRRLEPLNQGRRRVAERYEELLADVPGLLTPGRTPGQEVFHQYTVRILDGRRDEVPASLREAGIATAVYYPAPVHRLPAYADDAAECPNAERLAGEALSLPLWPTLAGEAQQRVADEIGIALGEAADSNG